MAELLKVDICVIGAGSGGLTVAAAASQLGVSVALIEKHLMGGDCLNFGCVPSKAMLAAAHTAQNMRHAGRFGLSAVEPQVDPAAVQAHIREVIDAIAPHDSVARFSAMGVDVIAGTARFLDRKTIQVDGRRIQARRFVIATGSRPMVPPIDGLEEIEYFTNETIFDNTAAMSHLLVIGGGPIGLELAQAHRRLGSAVTVIEMARALPNDDPEAAALLLRSLRGEGIRILEGARLMQVKPAKDGLTAIVEIDGAAREFPASHLLLAVGRRPNTEALDLDKVGVDYTARGIEVDRRLRTTNRKIFAIGDVAGGPQFTHAAGYHAGIVVQNALFRWPAKADNARIPWVTFCDPELAQAGLTDHQAQASHGGISVLRWPFSENDRAQAERRTEGFVKVVVAKNGRILGATIVGAHAGELLQPWILAIQTKMKISKMASLIAPYPTFGEASKRAAGSYYIPKIFTERMKKIVRLLAKFG